MESLTLFFLLQFLFLFSHELEETGIFGYLHIIHFPLSLSSLPHYQGEFMYIEKGQLQKTP